MADMLPHGMTTIKDGETLSLPRDELDGQFNFLSDHGSFRHDGAFNYNRHVTPVTHLTCWHQSGYVFIKSTVIIQGAQSIVVL